MWCRRNRWGGRGGLVYIGSGVDSPWVIFIRDLNKIRVGTPIVSYLLLVYRLRASLPGLRPPVSEILGFQSSDCYLNYPAAQCCSFSLH